MRTARLVLYRGNGLLRRQLRCALPNAEGIDVSLVLIDRARSVRDPADVREFVAWAAGVAREFPEVRRYVVWNEPGSRAFWHRGSALYARLLTETFDALHDVDPQIRVSGFGLGPSHRPVEFLRAALRAGARMDELSLHPFPPRNGASAAAAYRLVRRVERVWPGPLNLDETGWQVAARGRPYTGRENVPTTTEALQARRYVSFLHLAARDPHVRSVLVYRLADDVELRGWQSGLLRADGSRRRSFDAVARAVAGCLPLANAPLVAALACTAAG